MSLPSGRLNPKSRFMYRTERGSPKNPYTERISRASNEATLKRRMRCRHRASCERVRTGRVRDRLPCWAGWMAGEAQTQLLCGSGFVTLENEKSRDKFSNTSCTVTFFTIALGLGHSSQLQDSGVWMNPDWDRNWLQFSYWEKKKSLKVFLINMHLVHMENSSLSFSSEPEAAIPAS